MSLYSRKLSKLIITSRRLIRANLMCLGPMANTRMHAQHDNIIAQQDVEDVSMSEVANDEWSQVAHGLAQIPLT